MIQIICTILKRSDSQRRWKLISSHSGAEVLQADVDKWNSCSKPSCSVNSSDCRLSTRHPNQATVSLIIHSVQFISVVHLTQEIFPPVIKNRNVFFLFLCFFFLTWPLNFCVADYINVFPCFNWWPPAWQAVIDSTRCDVVCSHASVSLLTPP